MLENIILIILLAAILGAVIYYIARSKKRGESCIGCPYCKNCHGGCSHDKNN